VLVFFAGHGEDRQLPDGGTMGYLLPHKADPANLHATAIDMEEVRDKAIINAALDLEINAAELENFLTSHPYGSRLWARLPRRLGPAPGHRWPQKILGTLTCPSALQAFF
jgi:hypothetical protein